MSELAIIACEISDNKLLISKSKQAQIDWIADIILDCQEKELFYNELIAQIFLAFLQNRPLDQSYISLLQNAGYVREISMCRDKIDISNLYLIVL